ncbi:AraC family transcriptional regulator [uncultured Bacteroides sp.]|uniref:helix-turn-helix domain-containing protein n=1 Tax=uncultured Bacteroides sp. TaxID=162156 RepID=UPI0025CDBF6B|nr:helix-turn-helix domain-containing protein [uncultured Bacteroides sp.]
MDTQQDCLLQFDRDLLSGKNICSSRGVFVTFPSSLKKLFHMKGLGVIICRQGSFRFSLNQKPHTAKAGESLFIPEDGEFQVLQESENLEVQILIYQIEPIRDIMGNAVVTMYMYSRITPEEPCCVWATGEESEIMKYMSLLDSALQAEDNSFNLYEQKLLLLALTYRICSVYNRKLVNDGQEAGGRKKEVFIRLIQLIEKYYMQERGVEFYADKLCLSPKYLSAVSKSICGYTVQELVFKAIIRKSISLLKNTQKDIQEISNEFGFPNASYFGTFFKKQMGMSPQQYRKNL